MSASALLTKFAKCCFTGRSKRDCTPGKNKTGGELWLRRNKVFVLLGIGCPKTILKKTIALSRLQDRIVDSVNVCRLRTRRLLSRSMNCSNLQLSFKFLCALFALLAVVTFAQTPASFK